jgi:pyrroline-5-carboxylate reductase
MMIKALIGNKIISKEHIYVSNRSEGKLQKVVETYGIQSCATNESLIEACDIIILSMKPQDLPQAVEPLTSLFTPEKIVMSLAAGITTASLKKLMPAPRIVRVMPNTPISISKGVIGYFFNDKNSDSLASMTEDLLKPLGYVLRLEDEAQFEALTVSCASGTGFIFELMIYWQEWIEERGFDSDTARRMTVETFVGASQLASESPQIPLDELLAKVTSKKGITEAGLQSMRELEVERALRYSFEKAALKNQDLGKTKVN